MIKKIAWLILVVLGGSFNSSGQKVDSSYFEESIATKKIDREEWNSIVKGIDYSEEVEPEKPKKERQESDIDYSFLGSIIKFMVIVIGVGLIVFILVKVLSSDSLLSKRDKKIKGETKIYELEEIEENLMETELDGSIQKAIQDGNYALAVRLYYLAIIRELSLSKTLVWKKEKTNFQYLRELNNHPLKDSFRNTTNIFERIWYGEEPIPAERFHLIQPEFEKLLEASKK